MSVASQLIRELLENGVHFGHQTNKWNPKMGKYIFGEKSGIYIIDLAKTMQQIREAVRVVVETVSKHRSILFVGTKKQAKEVLVGEAERCGGYYITERWLGGMLTNFNTIKESIKKLKDMGLLQRIGPDRGGHWRAV